jgi:hypothetical protein
LGEDGQQFDENGLPLGFFDEEGNPVPVYDPDDKKKLMAFGGPVKSAKGVPGKLRGLGGAVMEPVPLYTKDGKPFMVGPGEDKYDEKGKKVPLVGDDGKPLKKPVQVYGSVVDDAETKARKPLKDKSGKHLMLGTGGPQHTSKGEPIPLFDEMGNFVPTTDSKGKPLLYAYGGPTKELPDGSVDSESTSVVAGKRVKSSEAAAGGRDGDDAKSGGDDESGEMTDDLRKRYGDEFREIIDGALEKGMEDPNRGVAMETGKLLHAMESLSPGVSDRMSKETKARYTKWKAGPMRRGKLRDFKSSPLPSLKTVKSTTYTVETDIEVKLSAPSMPDI